MASRTLTVTDARRVSGVTYIRFDDGEILELASIEHAREYIAPLRNNIKDLTKMFAVARLLHLDPTGANLNSIVGHSITVTNETNDMVSIT